VTSSSTHDIPKVVAMAAAGVPVGATDGGIGTVLGGLAGASPALADAYLGYLVVKMLIPAVLIAATIRGVPARQRSALLQSYLRATANHPQQQGIPHQPTPTDDPAAAAPAQAGGDHSPRAGDDE
jgi:hypothetical protein